MHMLFQKIRKKKSRSLYKQSVPNRARSPVQKFRVIAIREHASILLLWLDLRLLRLRDTLRLALLLLLLSPLFFLPSLPLIAIIEKKGKRAGECHNDQGLKKIRVDIIDTVIIVAPRHMMGLVVVLGLEVVPGCDLGFEEGG